MVPYTFGGSLINQIMCERITKTYIIIIYFLKFRLCKSITRNDIGLLYRGVISV